MKGLVALFVLFMSCHVICIWADPCPSDLAKPLSIPELLDIALSNNPETRTAWWNARRAIAARGLAASSYYPVIRGRASAAHGRDYKFPNGKETNYTSLNGDLLLSYLLYDFGERKAANDAAKAALWSADWQYDWAIQRVLYHVIANAYAYLNAQELLNSRQVSLQDAKTTLQAADDLQRVGLRSITDIYTMRAIVAEVEINVALQKAEVEVARGKLITSLGLCLDTPLSVATLPDPSLAPDLISGLDCLIALAQQERSDLMAKWGDLEQKQALQEKADKKYLPKLNFNSDAGYKRYMHDSSNGFYYNVGFSLDVPLFNGFESIYHSRMAYADVEATEAQLDMLELDIALEVMTYSRYFEAAQEVLKLAQENLQNSLLSFNGVLDKYKAGTQSIFDLTASQRQLAEARIKHSDAKTRWYRTLAQLAYATGTIAQYTEDSCAVSQ